jgi:hypothetical protein
MCMQTRGEFYNIDFHSKTRDEMFLKLVRETYDELFTTVNMASRLQNCNLRIKCTKIVLSSLRIDKPGNILLQFFLDKGLQAYFISRLLRIQLPQTRKKIKNFDWTSNRKFTNGYI